MNEPESSLLSLQRPRPVFGWLSLLMALVPILYLALLVMGGGRGGFAAWTDLGYLLIVMGSSAVLGVVFFVLSFRRDEQSVASYLAMFLCLFYLCYALWVVQQ